MTSETNAERRLREIMHGFAEHYPADADACDMGREAIQLLRETTWDHGPFGTRVRALLSRAGQAQEER